MSYREALKYFELGDLYTEKELNSKYYKLKELNFDQEEIKRINSMYEILSNELNKRNINNEKKIFLENINNLKNKYQDSLIYNVCIDFENRLKNINSLIDINKLKEQFDNKIKQSKIDTLLPLEKDKLIASISKYLDGYSKEMESFIKEQIEVINNSSSLEHLNSIKQKLDILLKKELILESDRVSEFKSLKEDLKKEMLTKFYNFSKELNSNDVLMCHRLLLSSLNLLNIADVSNIKNIEKILKDINYENINDEINRLEIYYLKISKKLEIEKYNLSKNNSKKRNIFNPKNDNFLISLILDKYYQYGIKKSTSIDKLVNEDSFKDTILMIDKLNIDRYKVIKFIETENFKSIKIILEGLNDFLDPNKLFIERDTGNLCIIKTSGKKMYTIFLDGLVLNDLKNERDIIWKYMPLMQFFFVSKYTNGMELEMISEKNSITMGDYNINYLYYTKDLILCLKDDGESCSFQFIPALKGYNYVTSENEQITRNSHFEYYKDKDTCLKDLVLSISNEGNNKENNIKKSFQI